MRGTAGGHRPGSPSCSTMACMSRMTAPVILRAIATCRHSMESICDTNAIGTLDPTAPSVPLDSLALLFWVLPRVAANRMQTTAACSHPQAPAPSPHAPHLEQLSRLIPRRAGVAAASDWRCMRGFTHPSSKAADGVNGGSTSVDGVNEHVLAGDERPLHKVCVLRPQQRLTASSASSDTRISQGTPRATQRHCTAIVRRRQSVACHVCKDPRVADP